MMDLTDDTNADFSVMRKYSCPIAVNPKSQKYLSNKTFEIDLSSNINHQTLLYESDCAMRSRKASYQELSYRKSLFQAMDDGNLLLDENLALEQVDAAGVSGSGVASMKWNATVDIETTQIMLQSLDEHIKSKKDKLARDVSQKAEMVDKLIYNFNLPPDHKLSTKIRREYESMNKSSEKSQEKTKIDLEQLEYKRMIIQQDGIPWGKNPADYVKSINIKDKYKKLGNSPQKDGSGRFAGLLKARVQKSASAENVSQMDDDKTIDSKPWIPKADSVKKNKENNHKYLTLNDSTKSSLAADESVLSKSTNYFQSNRNRNSPGNSSATSLDIVQGLTKGNQMKKSTSNSISSGTGREMFLESAEPHESKRKQSIHLTNVEDITKSDDSSLHRMQSIQDEVNSLEKDLHDVRMECNRLQCETDNLRLDMKTITELNSLKMQNAIEHVDRQERNMDTLKQKCQIEFTTWKNEFRNLEEKLDYRMTTYGRDLQDNIDACNNRINLIEKRTEQLPFMSTRSVHSDMRIITDHLVNLAVSLIAFIMLLISSGMHLLISVLNIGATISQHRNIILVMLMVIVITIVFSKWSLLSPILTNFIN